jgi:hypothetical protein
MRIEQIVQPELEEVLTGFGFAARLLDQTRDVRETERDTDLR